jgi:hypothetical protein
MIIKKTHYENTFNIKAGLNDFSGQQKYTLFYIKINKTCKHSSRLQKESER